MEKKGFFSNLGMAFNPFKYERVHETHGWSIFRYFLLLVLFGFLICTVLFIPVLYGDVSSQIGNFKELKINITQSMKSPVYLPSANPRWVIDTREKHVNPAGENLLMTEDDFYVKKPFFLGTEKFDSGDFKDLMENQGMLITLILLMLPSVMLMFYLYYLLKTLVVLFLVSVLALVITRIAKFDISFNDMMKVALWAVTPMVIVDFVRFPFGLFLFYGQYVLFLLFFVIGIVRAGDFETDEGRHVSKKVKHKKSRFD
ncbi:TPA: DUF1189 family protein [Candidatus Woesearchaeota archaeon]|nr:DUF1189 family protein [Candidatus Woesearchaeota archaeon]